MSYINFFVPSKFTQGTEGIIPAEMLELRTERHTGGEAYHCVFDLWDEALKVEEFVGVEEKDGKKKRICRYHAQTPETVKRFPKTTARYSGEMRPAYGRIWFDFDSHDGGESALVDVKKFLTELGTARKDAAVCYSGSKGFHIGLPFAFVGLEISPHLANDMNRIAHSLKARYPTLDTTVYNANRKFRVLGSKHPKTNLFKILITDAELQTLSVAEIQSVAAFRRPPFAFQSISADLHTLPLFDEMLRLQAALTNDSVPEKEARAFIKHDGKEAMEQCLFLKHCATDAKSLSEPEWYAAASIVGRFEAGRKIFHEISKPHATYSRSVTDDKFDQATRTSGPRTCDGVSKLWGGCYECPHYGKLKTPVQIMHSDVIPSESTGFYFVEVNGDKVSRTPDYNGLLAAFERDRPYKSVADLQEIHAFNSTHYEHFSKIEIKNFAETKMVPPPKENMRAEFYHKVAANQVCTSDFFEDRLNGLVNMKNGVLHVETLTVEKSSPLLGFRYVLPYEYDPTASCLFFSQWISNLMEGDEARVATLQEFVGFVLSGGPYKYHKMLWLSGSGRNGKSTFINLLRELVGEENTTAVSIASLATDRFASSALYGKLLNVSEEVGKGDLSQTGSIKALTGDSVVNAQKKFGPSFSFMNRAKMILSFNEIPHMSDFSVGMKSRPQIIPFNCDFTDEAVQDKTIPAKLRAELPGIFNWGMQGWQRLEKNGAFTVSQAAEEAMEILQLESDPMYKWMKEHCTFFPVGSSSNFESNEQLYTHYQQHMWQKNDKFVISSHSFGEKIRGIREFKLRMHRKKDARGFSDVVVGGQKKVDSNTKPYALRNDF